MDSLNLLLSKTPDDTAKVSKLGSVIMIMKANGEYQLAKNYNNQLLILSKKLNYKKGIALYYHHLGVINDDLGEYETSLNMHDSALSIRKTLKDFKGMASSFNNIGIVYQNIGEYSRSIDNLQLAINLSESNNYPLILASSHTNTGTAFIVMGNYPIALNHLITALKIYETLNYERGIASCLNNIGSVYFYQANYVEALNYYSRANKMYNESKNFRGQSSSLGNLGLIYQEMGNKALDKGNFEKALEEFKKALGYFNTSNDLSVKIDDAAGAARTISNMANTHSDIAVMFSKKEDLASAKLNYEQAFKYHFEVYSLWEKIGDKQSLAKASNNIGDLFVETGRTIEGKKYLLKGLEIAKEINSLDDIKYCYQGLYRVDSVLNDCDGMLENYRWFIYYKDSIYNEENTWKTIQQQFQYDYEKKEALLNAEHEKESILSEKENQKQKIISYSIGGSLVLVFGFLLFVFNRLKVTRRQKKLIEQQKKIVEEQKNLVEHQKEIVEEKNQEILDSITYAKRLQDAILPPVKLVKQNLENSFILYKPKDIVAGDFYWMELAPPSLPKGEVNYSPPMGESEGAILFAAADCTGHGVPGAMVSVVCSNALNRTVKEFGITEPGKILDKVTDLVIETFEKSEAEVKDGMDISLVSLEYIEEHVKGKQKASIKWSGANNPLWVVRPAASSVVEMTTLENTQFSLEEIKADKQPIGKYSERKPFTTHTIELNEGDSIYIFTDGYADQFGGEKGKKFKSSKMKELIISIQNESMEKQKQLINEAFENWKGSSEQIDDVCIIGVKI